MRIFFSAGEPSGDQHAAHLIQELSRRNPNFRAEGFGGPEMRNHGCELLFELTRLAVMGFLRVIPLLARFRRLVKQAEQHFENQPPDAVVLVDFPGFNWWIARAASRRGIPVYYYLPPQLWAWAPWRIKRVHRWVDHVICALPFEFDWYRAQGVKATWVGHPFFDEVAAYPVNDALVREMQQPVSEGPRQVIGLLPGSRNHEVERNWPLMLEVIRNVQAVLPDRRWIVANYKPEHLARCQELQQLYSVKADIQYFCGHTSEVIEASQCCLMVSGSISLELLARRTPGVVLYRVGRIGRFVSRFLMMCRYITLTNLIADAPVMPEYISVGNPKRDIHAMSDHLIRWCTDHQAYSETATALSELAERAAITGATRRTAELLQQELCGHLPVKRDTAA